MKSNSSNFVQRPISALREDLRQQAVMLSSRLSRAVSLQTSVDLPCPEYADELQKHQRVMSELMWVQRCRASLEAAIEHGSARCSTRLADGSVRVVSFRRENNTMKMRVVFKDHISA